MSHAPENFEMHQDRDFSILVTVFDDAVPPVLVDLTGGDAYFSISKTKRTKQLVSLNLAGAQVAFFSTQGGLHGISIDLLPANTATLKGKHYYEVVFVDTAGKDFTVKHGTITILESLIVAT